MAVVRIAALKDPNAKRETDVLFKIRPPCVIIDKGDTVRFLNLTGEEIEIAGAKLSFGEARNSSLTLPDGEGTMINHLGTRGRVPFTVMRRSTPGGRFDTEIHGESSPEIIIDQ